MKFQFRHADIPLLSVSSAFFPLAHCCGQRRFTVANDTSGVEVFSLFQSGFNTARFELSYAAPAGAP